MLAIPLNFLTVYAERENLQGNWDIKPPKDLILLTEVNTMNHTNKKEKWKRKLFQRIV